MLDLEMSSLYDLLKVPTMETMYVNGKLYQVLQCVGHGGSSKASFVHILSTALV